MKIRSQWFLITLPAAAGAFIYYCEALQLLPLTAKGLYGRLAIAFAVFLLLLGLPAFFLKKTLRKLTRREWRPILFASLVLSVCVMVWFPVPQTGIYEKHQLTVHALPDENGEFHPVTLTWLHLADRDIPLSAVRCEGNCQIGENGPVLMDEQASLSWYGKTGNTVTVEFLAGNDQGIVDLQWDGLSRKADLNNPEFSRLSFDQTFAPSNAFPEFFAVWLISFLLCFYAVSAAVKLLPGWNFGRFFISAFFLYAVFRIIQTLAITAPPGFVDSEFYLGQSRFTIAEILNGTKYCRIPEWHCLSRPVLIALVYKLCRQDTNLIIWVQTLIALLSWGFFAFHAAGLCKSDISKKITLILTLGLACIPNITCWDGAIMSESLSISTGALLAGSLFWLTCPAAERKWHRASALCTCLSTLLFVNSRDSALWTVVFILIMLVCIAQLRSNKRVLFLTAAFLICICVICARNTGDRWVYSYENVLFNRILRDPQGERFFIESGMPVPAGLHNFYGVQHAMIYPEFNSEEFKPFRDWILSDGLKTYVRYLLRTPMQTLRTTWHAVFEKEAFENISYKFTPTGFKRLLPDPVIKLFSCNIPGVMLIGLALAALFPLFLSDKGERYAFPALFVLAAYLLAAAAYLSDECDADRHMLGMIVMMKGAAWPLIVMLCEDLAGSFSKKLITA